MRSCSGYGFYACRTEEAEEKWKQANRSILMQQYLLQEYAESKIRDGKYMLCQSPLIPSSGIMHIVMVASN